MTLINCGRSDKIWYRIEHKRPWRDFCVRLPPRLWKKNPGIDSECERYFFFRKCKLRGFSSTYFIRVDFPEPGFPLIQNKPLSLCSQLTKPALSSYIQEKACLCASDI